MKKSSIIGLAAALILVGGVAAEAAGSVSEARLKVGNAYDQGVTVSVSSYNQVGIYGKSNGGDGAANVSYSIKDQKGGDFKSGTIYTGKPDLNYFVPNAVTSVKSTISKPGGKHTGAVVRAQGV